jgi:type II secretory pathway pseudopilin PulG
MSCRGRVMVCRTGDPRRAAGFTYIGLLIAVAILGLGLAEVGTIWRTQAQREREEQLLVIGHEFKRAIASYYAAGGHQLPLSIDVLLEDKRFQEPKHHLRKLYADPMTGAPDWTLVSDPMQGISGIASSSKAVPIKKHGFDDDEEDKFKDAKDYGDWQFIFVPRFRLRHPVTTPPPSD